MIRRRIQSRTNSEPDEFRAGRIQSRTNSEKKARFAMTIQRLSKLRDWRLKDKHQNLCGHDLRTRDGELLGTVTDMVVDTEARLVTSVILQDGRHVATEDIDIEDGKVWMRPSRVRTGEEFPPADTVTSSEEFVSREKTSTGGTAPLDETTSFEEKRILRTRKYPNEPPERRV
jgi:sporulation protein YlmC with PRC-barrel domain